MDNLHDQSPPRLQLVLLNGGRSPPPELRRDAPESPCVGCRQRPSCREICGALEAKLPPPPRPRYREIGSDALMQGRLRAGAVLPKVGDEPAERSQDSASPRYSALVAPLHQIVDELPPDHREIVMAHYGDKSTRTLARHHRTSVPAIREVLRQSRDWIRQRLISEFHEPPANFKETYAMKPDNNAPSLSLVSHDIASDEHTVSPTSSAAPSEAALDDRKKVSRGRRASMAGLKCRMPGCSNPVGRKPAALGAELLCVMHRRQLAKAPSSTISMFAELRLTPTLEERSTLQALLGHQAPCSVLVQMTPAMAAALLERNPQNRKLAPERINAYAEDMRAGAWHLNSQSIGLGRDATLLDGQHRLHGVVRAQCTVPMFVACGLSPSARGTIDQGRPRSIGDNLRILEKDPNGGKISQWFKMIDELVTGKAKPLSYAMILRLRSEYQTSIEWMLQHGPRVRPWYRTPVVAALLYAHRVLATEVERFTRGFVAGANLPAGSPSLALRDYLAVTSDVRGAIAAKTLRCLVADIRGEQIERVFASAESVNFIHRLHLQQAEAKPEAA